MRFLQRDSVRAFLPAVALAFCHGCGGGGSEAAGTQGSSSALVAGTNTPANRAPTISAADQQVARVGVAYEFQPMSDDADGDSLTFSAANLPPWATFDASSGRIIGTPSASDVGAYESVTITVADATHHTSIQPFQITVLGAANGVARLEWEKPPTKFDGSPLDDLAGYRIAYGHDANDLDESVYLDDPEQRTYEFATLGSGVWYFEVIAVSADGLEGPPSTSAMKSI
jgi:Putative Ig domain